LEIISGFGDHFSYWQAFRDQLLEKYSTYLLGLVINYPIYSALFCFYLFLLPYSIKSAP